MSSWDVVAAAAAAVLAVVSAVASGPILRGISEPSGEVLHGAPAPGYALLPTWRFLTGVAVSVFVGVVVIGASVPPDRWPVWIGICTVGVLLAWIDARTTWLPAGLTRILGLATLVGYLAVTAGRWIDGEPVLHTLIPGLVALGAGALFLVVHLSSRGALGFGDVRLIVPLVLAAASVSLQTAMAALLVGTVGAACWAVVRRLISGRTEFAYGPWLVAGCLLAPLTAALGG